MENNPQSSKEQGLIKMIQRMLNLIIVLVLFIVLLPLVFYNADNIKDWFSSDNAKAVTPAVPQSDKLEAKKIASVETYWQPVAMDLVADAAEKELVYFYLFKLK